MATRSPPPFAVPKQQPLLSLDTVYFSPSKNHLRLYPRRFEVNSISSSSFSFLRYFENFDLFSIEKGREDGKVDLVRLPREYVRWFLKLNNIYRIFRIYAYKFMFHYRILGLLTKFISLILKKKTGKNTSKFPWVPFLFYNISFRKFRSIFNRKDLSEREGKTSNSIRWWFLKLIEIEGEKEENREKFLLP